MAIRYYLSSVIGDGQSPDTAFRAAVIAVAPLVSWKIHDCRVDDTTSAGEMLAWADVSGLEHDALIISPGVTYIPFEDESGNVLGVDSKIGDLSVANRTSIQTALENRHVPIQGLTLTDEIYVILTRFKSRCRIRQWLRANDYTEFLDDPISKIPGPKRNAIKARLEELGFDLSGITASTLIRDALTDLITQDITI